MPNGLRRTLQQAIGCFLGRLWCQGNINMVRPDDEHPPIFGRHVAGLGVSRFLRHDATSAWLRQVFRAEAAIAESEGGGPFVGRSCCPLSTHCGRKPNVRFRLIADIRCDHPTERLLSTVLSASMIIAWVEATGSSGGRWIPLGIIVLQAARGLCAIVPHTLPFALGKADFRRAQARSRLRHNPADDPAILVQRES